MKFLIKDFFNLLIYIGNKRPDIKGLININEFKDNCRFGHITKQTLNSFKTEVSIL